VNATCFLKKLRGPERQAPCLRHNEFQDVNHVNLEEICEFGALLYALGFWGYSRAIDAKTSCGFSPAQVGGLTDHCRSI
jgi:hypothetical protein